MSVAWANVANVNRAPAFLLPSAVAPRRASRVLRAVLLALREWMTVDEVVDLARHLPAGWVPVFFEDWVPGSITRQNPTRPEFIASVTRHLGLGQIPAQAHEIADALQALTEILPDRRFLRTATFDLGIHTGMFH